MAQRKRINVQDYYEEDYGDDYDYYGELDDEERAIKDSKKDMKKAKKQAKSKYLQSCSHQHLSAQFRGQGSLRGRHRYCGSSLPRGRLHSRAN